MTPDAPRRPLAEPLGRPVRLACLISGGGRTVLNLHERIAAGTLDAAVVAVLASRDCPGVARCEAAGLPVEVLPPRPPPDQTAPDEGAFGGAVFARVEAAGADLVVLAGFLSRLPIPPAWALRVLNVHPSLLPAFGGRGMYGDRVHRAALDRGVTVSGCTVHFVTDEYDAGPILSQTVVPVEPDDDAATLAARVFAAECEALPAAVRAWAAGTLVIEGNRVRTVRRAP